jgi:hypothetical protein
MEADFDWEKFEQEETAKVLAAMEDFERSKLQTTACLNHADESTLAAFEKAVEVSIDLFVEKTKNLR